MRRALSLARRGTGKTSPNPLTGAVIARDGIVLGEGWHRQYKGKHAELEALESAAAAGHTAEGADLYCTLEPCSFTGPEKHQPPCTTAIIKHRIRRVIIANQDPHPKVNGQGVQALQAAGIVVETGLLARKGEELNRFFFTFHRLGRPWVHLKIAQSLDGRIAVPGGEGKNRITNEAARKLVHRLRRSFDAVLIGRGTALIDDPELTVRLERGRNPLRVVLDSRLSIPDSARLLRLPDREKTLIFCAAGADPQRIRRLEDQGAQVIPIAGGPAIAGPENQGGLPLDQVLQNLGARKVLSVLVEGGAAVFSSFLREGLWDRMGVFIAPIILGGGVNAVSGLPIASMEEALGFQDVEIRRIGNQILFEGTHVYRNR